MLWIIADTQFRAFVDFIWQILRFVRVQKIQLLLLYEWILIVRFKVRLHTNYGLDSFGRTAFYCVYNTVMQIHRIIHICLANFALNVSINHGRVTRFNVKSDAYICGEWILRVLQQRIRFARNIFRLFSEHTLRRNPCCSQPFNCTGRH